MTTEIFHSQTETLVHGPLKKFVNSVSDSWLRSQSGRDCRFILWNNCCQMYSYQKASTLDFHNGNMTVEQSPVYWWGFRALSYDWQSTSNSKPSNCWTDSHMSNSNLDVNSQPLTSGWTIDHWVSIAKRSQRKTNRLKRNVKKSRFFWRGRWILLYWLCETLLNVQSPYKIVPVHYI
jgi:hypothetical protein